MLNARRALNDWGSRKSLKLLINEGVLIKRGERKGEGGSENKININKWGWDGQLELAISKKKSVKRIVKTSTKHNHILKNTTGK